MSLIDVSGLLTDPDLVDPIIQIHRTAWVDQYGNNQTKSEGFNTFGVVYPAPHKDLERLPEALRVHNIKSFVIKGRIFADKSNSQYPDILVHYNVRYEVMQVLDYSNYGAGFTQGLCVGERLS